MLVLALRITAKATQWNKTALSPFTENFNIPFDVDVLPDYPFNLYFHNQKWLFNLGVEENIYDPNYPAHTHIWLQETGELKISTNFSDNPVLSSENEIALWRQDLIDPKPTEPISIKIKAGLATEYKTEIPYSFIVGILSPGTEEYIRVGWDGYDQGSNIVLATHTNSWNVVPSFKADYEDIIEFSFTLSGTTISYSVIQNTTTLAEGTKSMATFPYTMKMSPLIYIGNRYRASDTFNKQQLSIKSWVDTAGTTNWEKEVWENILNPSLEEDNRRILATLQRQDFDIIRSTIEDPNKIYGTGVDADKYYLYPPNPYFFDESGAYIIFDSGCEYVTSTSYLKVENGLLKLFPSPETIIIWENRYFPYDALKSTITVTGEFILPNDATLGKVRLGFYKNSNKLCMLIWDGDCQEWQIYYWIYDTYKTIASCPTLQAGKYKLLLSLHISNVYYEIWKDDNLEYSGIFDISPVGQGDEFSILCPTFWTTINIAYLDWIEWWKGDKKKWEIENPKLTQWTKP